MMMKGLKMEKNWLFENANHDSNETNLLEVSLYEMNHS